MEPNAPARALRAALLTAVACLPGLAAAQEATFALSAGTRIAADVEVREVPRGGGVLGAEVQLAADPGAALRARWSDAFGALGTLVIEGEVEGRLAGPPAARASVGVRGVLGPVAARLGAGVDGAPAERFEAAGASGDAPYARGAWLALDAEGRIDRTWLASGGATAWRHDDGAWTIDLRAGARARAALRRELDAQLGVQMRLGSDAPSWGVGVGAVWSPRRAPEVGGRLWFDLLPQAAGLRIVPGAEVSGAWRVGADRLDVAVVARPGGPARAPWSLDASWRRPWDEGDLIVRAGARHGGVAGPALQLGVAYARAFSASSTPAEVR